MKQKRRFKRALLGALIVLLVAGTTGCTGTRMIKYVIRRVWSPGSGKSAGSDVLGKDTSSKLGVLDELIDVVTVILVKLLQLVIGLPLLVAQGSRLCRLQERISGIIQ